MVSGRCTGIALTATQNKRFVVFAPVRSVGVSSDIRTDSLHK
jgi:hypothetical protein